MALAIDKARVVEKYTKGGERPAGHFVPPGTGNYTSPSGLTHDAGLAKRLLAEAGYPGGKGFPTDFEYLFNSSPLNKNIAVELQRMWRETLGIQVKLRQAEHKVYLAAQSALDYHVTRSSWIGDYNDPNTFLDMFMTQNGNNRTGWANADYDRLIRLANATTDPAKRNELVPPARRPSSSPTSCRSSRCSSTSALIFTARSASAASIRTSSTSIQSVPFTPRKTRRQKNNKSIFNASHLLRI